MMHARKDPEALRFPAAMKNVRALRAAIHNGWTSLNPMALIPYLVGLLIAVMLVAMAWMLVSWLYGV
jgi:hypothetical protein